MENKNSISYFALVLIIYVGTFWSFIQDSVIGLFSYWDEILALVFLLILVIIILYSREGRIQISKDSIWIYQVLYVMVGLISNFLFHITSFKAAMFDAFINIKFVVVLFGVVCIFESVDLSIFYSKMKTHVRLISLIYLVLFIVDKAMHIFPVYEQRFGIDSEQLIFAHPTYMAASCCFLLSLYIICIKDSPKIVDICVIFVLVMLTCMTQRYKALGSILVLFALYLLQRFRTLRKVKYICIVICILALGVIAYDNIYFYFLSSEASRFPRGAIFQTSFIIAKDYFPFGTGFASFGSYFSGAYYSNVYSMYGLSNIYGMTVDNIEAISDNYWPMILGQTGIIGLFFQILVWVKLYKKINLFDHDSNYYLSSMFIFLFLLISSTSESSIVNPIGVAMMMSLGLSLSQQNIENNLN